MILIEIIKAFIFGIIEGITEWLPVSSTGHIILLDEFLHLNVAPELGTEFASEFGEMFEVVIQLGAILAVVVMFWGKLCPFGRGKGQIEKKNIYSMWLKIIVASIPAALIGVVGDKLILKLSGKDIDGWLFNAYVVASMLILYGILFIIIEKVYEKRQARICSIEDISLRSAFLIGVFQALSIVPGTSRSGSTILGARTLGVERTAAAEFSFFLGIPAMLGAGMLKALGFIRYVSQNGISVPINAYVVLILAATVAFLTSLLCIRFLMDFVKKHSFIPFGVYRIILGAAVLVYFAVR